MKLFERSPEDYVPFAGHFPNAPDAAFMVDGTVFAVLKMEAAPFELEGADLRNARTDLLNAVVRQASDDNVVIYSHLVRHADVRPYSPPQAISAFARDLQTAYRRAVLTDLRTNTWFLTIMVRPAGLDAKRGMMGRRAPRAVKVSPAQLRQLEDTVAMVTASLTAHAPRRLGLRTEPTDMPGHELTFTEIGEALFLMRTALPLAVPYGSGSLGGAVYSHRVIVGPRSFDLNIPGYRRFGSIVTFRNYPNAARPGCLNELLSAPYDLVLSQSFQCLLSGEAERRMSLKSQQMRNLGDRAVSLQAGLDAAMDDLASGRVTKGMHHLSVAVYRESLAALETDTGDAMRRLTNYGGANPMREGRLGAECAYFAQLPGVLSWRTRPGRLDSKAFAAMSSFEGFPAGQASGHWGPAIARFRTRAGTAYDFVPTVDDVGHTIFLGRTGRGKTALANFLMASLEPVMGKDGIRLIIDKDAGSKIMVELSGGRYLPLRRGTASGLAPLRGLSDTPANRSFLFNLFRSLIVRDGLGPIDPDEEARMARGIATQLGMPAELRSMAGVREFMGFAKNGAGSRFEKWCRGGEMGWVLDNDEHHVDFRAPVAARLYGFDFTELVPKEGAPDDGACLAAASVIIHQMRDMMDGRRIAAFFDECRFYLDVLGRVIEDFALTGRKNDLMAWMAAQEPSHFLDHPRGRSIIGQAATKICFPDASADIEAYVTGLKLSRAAAEQIKTGMNIGTGRRFLLWRDEAPAVCDFDLSTMPDELAILSGRASTVRMLDRITASHPGDAYSEFRRQNMKQRTTA